MKNLLNIKTKIVQAIFITTILLGNLSCSTPENPENTKEIAKDQNEDLYGNTRKEKDALFLVNAAEINLQEIQLGQLAQQLSKTEDIKNLGKMMEAEHRKSLDQLIILAHKKSIVIPKSLTSDALTANEKLLNTLSTNFDVEYSKMMVDGHRDAISLFDEASTESTDLDIKEWAVNTLPYLQSHLDYAMICQNKYDIKK
jgi:putative membrane protein